jgi:hemerythrin superfamily protein
MARKQKSVNDNAGASAGQDAIQLLESQHRSVERLFQSIENKSGKEAHAAVLEIIDQLTVHTHIEERHLYPAVRTSESEELIDDAYEDHREVKEVCLHLLEIGPDDPDYSAKLEELQGLFEEHVSIEESELFPMARDLLEEDRLSALCEQMIASMTELEQEGASTKEQLSQELGERA